ncbi:pyridoxamine 5'-phosphate oxidase-domain-containing protein [Gilbertella persicaria]|uniref:pyridoxamine 5'-phosphate oxidase-domain-containing protein n=1 Tax=Gilbertella persicaria TaxID=101096 RepID=UPI00221F965B|nr:pyridoxamine 5'-phosphate oxidase-domain-containing protein [Gilbertella persicaria]KAI8090202.1 pyridoxamine 5'-phosphate oxidase-domain-containing protein [Gilbertella persicaria]
MAKIPEWKKAIQSSLKENISKIGSSATYASLATVRENNTPAVRTIVIRGFAGEHHKEQVGWQSNILLIMTKNSSAKVKELTKNPKTEINWYMDGTKEQFRIGGTIDIIEKNFDQSKLNHLSASVTKTNQGAENDKKSLGLQSFLKRQGDKDKFDWEAERLRQFIQCSSSLRADMIRGDTKELEIKSIDLKTGWFQNDDIQDLLEQSFEKFTLLAVTVQSVGYYSAETGNMKSML